MILNILAAIALFVLIVAALLIAFVFKANDAADAILPVLSWEPFARDTHFASGETNPCACEEDDDRKHWLIDC